jgi:hypothetical protein
MQADGVPLAFRVPVSVGPLPAKEPNKTWYSKDERPENALKILTDKNEATSFHRAY